MTHQRAYGDSHPNSVLNAALVRQIRLLHYCNGVSASQIARDLKMHSACISRIVNWRAWSHQDHDLKIIPKPKYKNNQINYYVKLERIDFKLTCRNCLHFNENTGLCDFGFPECLSNSYQEATNCNVFVKKNELS